jgi:hypothetical protein
VFKSQDHRKKGGRKGGRKEERKVWASIPIFFSISKDTVRQTYLVLVESLTYQLQEDQGHRSNQALNNQVRERAG